MPREGRAKCHACGVGMQGRWVFFLHFHGGVGTGDSETGGWAAFEGWPLSQLASLGLGRKEMLEEEEVEAGLGN